MDGARGQSSSALKIIGFLVGWHHFVSESLLRTGSTYEIGWGLFLKKGDGASHQEKIIEIEQLL